MRGRHTFFALAAQGDITRVTMVFPLTQANEALAALRRGQFDGAAAS
jgi:D-arabinose 1-dehydrogenase-like Zn-dependent alcohol dehydrogenase